MNMYVAVDIGASSGRLLLGMLNGSQLKLEEVHRFKNGFTYEDGHDRWQIDNLINEIFNGLEKIKKRGINQVNLGIDTWAVDYVLVDENGQKMHNPVAYRDARTNSAIKTLTSSFPKEYIYEKTGIQFQDFNTLYQLYSEDKSDLEKAEKVMMIPDYLGYVLTGNAVTEVTNASTTQMLNLRQGLFDKDLMEKVDVDADQFPHLVEAGTVLGDIRRKWHKQYDIPETTVITTATHDTASAVVGTPGIGDNWAFLSSGTWSLLGTELNTPENGLAAFKENYTNEWGAYGTYRFLKNIMGLWIIQKVKEEFDNKYSFAELATLSEKEKGFRTFININDSRFQNPTSMIQTIQQYASETEQFVPQSPGEIARVIYDNLSLFYADSVHKLSNIIGHPITTLNIVGGGSNVALMNQMTANLAGIEVIAGPDEATAIGNILVQMIANKDVKNIVEGRRLIMDSFSLKTYKPQGNINSNVLEDYQKFLVKN